MVAFPLGPTPAWYAHCSFPTRNGIFYADGTGGPPTVTLSQATATAYTVRDYTGAVVSSGTIAGTSVVPAAPAGGWECGWYRLYLTGPNTGPLFGASYGATNFLVIPRDARFPTNPAAGTPGGGAPFGEGPDFVTKGVLGLGTSRLSIGNAAAPTADPNGGTIANCQAAASTATSWWAGRGDGVRPRDLWCNLAAQSTEVDVLSLAGVSGTYLRVYAADETVNGAAVYVGTGPGGTTGTRVSVYAPDAATLVETYDNLATSAAAVAAINATSSRIKVFDGGSNQQAATAAPRAIGAAYFTGTAQYVAALYPTVRFFEGPSNEPTLGAETAHQMRLFAGAVHGGNPAAQAIGPCPVSLDPAGWDAFLAAGGGAWCDVFSFHDYNSMTGGNLALGRHSIESWVATLTKYGMAAKPRWQTEAGMAFKSVYGVHHPRRAGWKPLHTLLWEQYGVPAERNTPWYDQSHGFWSYPDWLINGDTSLNADAGLLRTLTAETWGRPFAAALRFGPLGDAIMVGNVYTGADGTSTVALCAAAQMPGQTVTLTVTGPTGQLTAVDAWGNLGTAAISNGRITLPTPAQPVYLRLPVGATVAAFSINDWPAIGARGQGASSSARASGPSLAVTDGQWMPSYGSGLGVYAAAPPDSYTLSWDRPQFFDRVLIWNAMSWQAGASLLDFDVQTSADGATWTTRATVTKTASSFLHGTDATNVGCQYETYWDEQWIFDVKLPAPVIASYLRLNVRATSYGGEPDAQALSAGGQGGQPRIVLQEIAVLCDANVTPQYVTS